MVATDTRTQPSGLDLAALCTQGILQDAVLPLGCLGQHTAPWLHVLMIHQQARWAGLRLHGNLLLHPLHAP